MNLFETQEQVETIVRPGVVLHLKPTGTEDVWFRVKWPPTFSTSMGRLTVHLRGERLTVRGIRPHHRPKEFYVVLLSQILGIEAR